MSLPEHARLLVRYNGFASRRVLAAAFQLDDAALEANSNGHGSVMDKLRHIVSAEATWQRRWSGRPAPDADVRDRQGLAAAFEASQAAMVEFAEALEDADWERVIEYSDSRGVDRAVPLGHLITHVVNHGTMHRGEAGMLLAAHGASPGDLDFVLWSLEGEPA